MLLALLFVIIIYVVYSMYDPNDHFTTAGLMAVGMAFLVLVYSRSESLVDGPAQTQLRPVDNNVHEIDNSDGVSINKNFDMPMAQTDRDIDFSIGKVENSETDNGDVVTQFLTGGAQAYVPQEVQSDNYYSVHDLAYPKHPGEAIGEAKPDVLYGSLVPLNDDAISMDDKLARGQTHRSEMNKRAIDGAVRATRHQFDKYFANELPENESREWWNNQADDNETDYKYFQ